MRFSLQHCNCKEMVFCAEAMSESCLVWRLLLHQCWGESVGDHSSKELVEDWYYLYGSIVLGLYGVSTFVYNCDDAMLPTFGCG